MIHDFGIVWNERALLLSGLAKGDIVDARGYRRTSIGFYSYPRADVETTGCFRGSTDIR